MPMMNDQLNTGDECVVNSDDGCDLIVDIYPLSNYFFSSKPPPPPPAAALRLKSKYEDVHGMRNSVEAVILVRILMFCIV
ncbi:hypothetical protein Hanom_Chr09g00762531 [Helianthus anomalus]